MAFLIGGANSAADTGYDIDNSLRFNDGDTAYLSRTPSSSGSRTIATVSFWVKRSELGDESYLLEASSSTSPFNMTRVRFSDSDELIIDNTLNGSAANGFYFQSDRLYRDVSAWYHIFFSIDVTEANATDGWKLYVNGVQQTKALTYWVQNANLEISQDDVEMNIGRRHDNSTDQYDGYLAEYHYIDGTIKAYTDFGEFDEDSGIWKPKEYTGGSYGTNGFFLEFKQTGITHTITAAGNVHHETDQKKFGGSSIHFDGTGDYLSIPASNDFHFGTGSYTIEMWVYNTVSAYSFLLYNATGDSNSTGVRLALTADGYVQMNEQVDNVDVPITGDVDVADGAWHHIAVCRDADDDGEMEIYVDGILDEKLDGSANRNFNTIGNVWYIGSRQAGSSPYTGYIDELRISNSARYTSNFTPSASAFSDDDNTVLLLHSDTSDGSTTFVDSSGLKKGVGADTSGNGNDFTETNCESKDQCTDSPTNNFCTINPVYKDSGNNTVAADYSEGNTKMLTTVDAWKFGRGTFLLTSGKWYAEVKATETGNGEGGNFGIVPSQGGVHLGYTDDNDVFEGSRITLSGSSTDLEKLDTGTGTAIFDDFASGSTAHLAIDLDNNKLWVGHSGTWYNDDNASATLDASNEDITLPSVTAGWVFGVGTYRNGSDNITYEYNWGNPPNAISSGNSDANGYGNFEFAVPSGFYAVCTKNLAEYG